MGASVGVVGKCVGVGAWWVSGWGWAWWVSRWDLVHGGKVGGGVGHGV